MASAWYHLGANLNRRVTDERITTIGNSFLSQQRHLPAVLSTNTSYSPVLNNSSKKHGFISPNNNNNNSNNNFNIKNSNLNDSID